MILGMNIASTSTASERPAGAIHDLAVAARAGEAGAFDELVRIFAPRLHRYLVMMGVQQSDADDLVQDAFIRAYQAIDRFDERYAFSTWLFTIGRRLACNFFRGNRRHLPLAEQGYEDGARPAAPGGDAAAALDAGITWRVAREALSPKYYEAVWLFYGEDLSMKEVAKVLGITALNAKVTVHRARGKLADALQERGISP